MDNLLLAVIILFSILTFTSLVLDDPESTHFLVLEAVELFLLLLFLIEILLKFYAVGFVSLTQRYFRSPWNAFDFLIVVLCLVVAALSFMYGTRQIGFLKFSVILRLMRVTVALRKFGEFHRIKDKRKRTGLCTDFCVDVVSERVLAILGTVLQEPWLQTNEELLAEVQWCMEVIRSNKLQETIVTVAQGKDNPMREAELFTLVNEYSASRRQEAPALPKRHSSSSSNLPHLSRLESDPNLENSTCLSSIDKLDFNIFELKKVTSGRELFTIMHFLFSRSEMINILMIPPSVFRTFVENVQRGYNAEVPYHNATHAADVTQTLNYFLNSTEAGETLDLSVLETAGAYLAASVHDFEHPGVNNAYLVNTQAPLAIRYNDKSVLENHHISAAFALMMNEENDIFASLSPSDYSSIRSEMIDMVLATDISQHFTSLSRFKSKYSGTCSIDSSDHRLCLQVLIHAADISNPSKPWHVCYRWTELIISEFWAQGDKEREEGLPVSYMMDRFTVNVAKMQIGFIDVIVTPTFQALREVFPLMEGNCKNLEENREKWNQREGKYAEELKARE